MINNSIAFGPVVPDVTPEIIYAYAYLRPATHAEHFYVLEIIWMRYQYAFGRIAHPENLEDRKLFACVAGLRYA